MSHWPREDGIFAVQHRQRRLADACAQSLAGALAVIMIFVLARALIQ